MMTFPSTTRGVAITPPLTKPGEGPCREHPPGFAGLQIHRVEGEDLGVPAVDVDQSTFIFNPWSEDV
jgi:hypothetical protein